MSDEFITRPELTAAIDSIRRELSGYAKGQAEMNTKLDTILSSKAEDARQMGGLQEQVRRLGQDVHNQGEQIATMRAEASKAAIVPRDTILHVMFDLVKIALVAGLGYLAAHRGLP
jgi:hypothetical protein